MTSHSPQASRHRGRTHVRLSADDLETIVELAITTSTGTAREVLRRIAGQHPGDGAAEVIRGILDRGSGPTPPPFTRVETAPPLPTDPVLGTSARRAGASLAAEGEGPTSALLVGASGSGRTTFARWVAGQRRRPLWFFDLAAAHGTAMDAICAAIRQATDTGGTAVLEHADGLVTRDQRALGELARVVGDSGSGIVLAEVEAAPSRALASVFATVVELDPPTVPQIQQLLARRLGRPTPDSRRLQVLAAMSAGETPGVIVESVRRARRFAEVSGVDATEALFGIVQDRCLSRPLPQRRDAALALVHYASLSQRTAGEMTGVSRDTLRRRPPV